LQKLWLQCKVDHVIEQTPFTIEIDGDVWEALKAEAEPFVDSPNDVLRRQFGLDEVPAGNEADPPEPAAAPRAPRRSSRRAPRRASSNGKPAGRKRAPRGSLLPGDAYELPILSVLEEHGGRAPASEVIDAVGRIVADRLTALDHETLATGGLRWQKRVQFSRLRLVERGFVKRDSPRGVWEITDDGRRALSAGSTSV
jgi:hypothetical protein